MENGTRDSRFAMPLVLNSPNDFFAIGERINPSGNKRLAAAFENSDWESLVAEAERQFSAGANAIDVNVGISPRSSELMRQAVRVLDQRGLAPLVLDSISPEVLEAGLEETKGEVILNSVKGDDQSINSLLPIIAKRRIPFIGLTIDERGIPDSWKTRVEIAEKIAGRAKDHGIPPEHIMIDCASLPLRHYPEAVFETLKAVQVVRENLGVWTCLGISNVSFGLKQREEVNAAFLRLPHSFTFDDLRSKLLDRLPWTAEASVLFLDMGSTGLFSLKEELESGYALHVRSYSSALSEVSFLDFSSVFLFVRLGETQEEDLRQFRILYGDLPSVYLVLIA
jgi:5-methyltetrahydrofolate--homocysteine methyltransferase